MQCTNSRTKGYKFHSTNNKQHTISYLQHTSNGLATHSSVLATYHRAFLLFLSFPKSYEILKISENLQKYLEKYLNMSLWALAWSNDKAMKIPCIKLSDDASGAAETYVKVAKNLPLRCLICWHSVL